MSTIKLSRKHTVNNKYKVTFIVSFASSLELQMVSACLSAAEQHRGIPVFIVKEIIHVTRSISIIK
jgi:hypothetical protein